MHQMSDEMWKRHANPWSVGTRFVAIPAFMFAVWSRVSIGWWSLIPIALVVLSLFLNVFVFPSITSPHNWASKGIYGEKLWLSKRSEIPKHYAVMQQRLIALGLIGMILIAGGLYELHPWISIPGAVILILAQLWRIDRFSTLYELYEEKNY
jgi:membrane protein YdbS with pleckstrin-like domain